MSLENYFDRVVVLTLKRRPDRFESFKHNISLVDGGWPFRAPITIYGIDGRKVPLPHGWDHGLGTYGCMQSHRRLLEDAMMDNVDKLLILEDDAFFVEDFAKRVKSFLDEVPKDWEGLMLGGQHIKDPILQSPGVLRCTNCQRTHGYAVRGNYLRDLYQHWISTAGHCDHRMGDIQHKYKVYAPIKFLVGQIECESDINGSFNAAQLWVEPSEDSPLIFLKAPKEVAIRTNTLGLHGGRRRNQDSGIDVGLIDVFQQRSESDRLKKLRDWVIMIQREAISIGGHTTGTIWHPKVTEEMIRQVRPHIKLFTIDAMTVASAMEQFYQLGL